MADIEKEKIQRPDSVEGDHDVLHVVDHNDEMIRFKIDSRGNILSKRKLSGLNLEAIKNVRAKLAESQLGSRLSEAQGNAKRRLRKAVTGNPEKKVRDYMKEVPQVKLVDKLSFTFGVICIVLTEFLALRQPTYFTQYYLLLMTCLLTNRYLEYSALNEHLFMLDFCYFMNFSVVVQTTLFPTNLLWFKANYVLCMGVLMLAIVVWQNSLVFHSLDKLTSIFIHVFPPLTLHLYRWGLIPCQAIHPDDTMSLSDITVLPLILYGLWQIGYLLATEVVLANKIRNDPTIVTSLRHLAKDKKNGMNMLTTKVTKAMGILKKDESFDSEALKSKVIFFTVQGIYTILASLPTMFLYSNYKLSVFYICSIYSWCIWRGGSFYIEVFSERYKMKFITLEKEDSNLSREGSFSDDHVTDTELSKDVFQENVDVNDS